MSCEMNDLAYPKRTKSSEARRNGDRPGVSDHLHSWRNGLPIDGSQKIPIFAVQQALAFRDVSIAKKGGKANINAFQWAKARLTLEHPVALAAVQRFEADSKFFRSFVVVLVITAL